MTTEATTLLPRPISVSPEGADPVTTEWILTNGIGGFSMGTVLGVPTRRYHALLVAAMRPPIARVAALHSMDERITIDRGTPAERSEDLLERRALEGVLAVVGRVTRLVVHAPTVRGSWAAGRGSGLGSRL